MREEMLAREEYLSGQHLFMEESQYAHAKSQESADFQSTPLSS